MITNYKLKQHVVLLCYLNIRGRDSLYRETGWGKLSSRRERRKLCLMYNMYHNLICVIYYPLLLVMLLSSLKYYLFRSNIITFSRCVCRFIREDASHFLLKCRLYCEQGTVLVIFYTTIIFGEIIELYYLETFKRTRLEIFCYQK